MRRKKDFHHKIVDNSNQLVKYQKANLERNKKVGFVKFSLLANQTREVQDANWKWLPTHSQGVELS